MDEGWWCWQSYDYYIILSCPLFSLQRVHFQIDIGEGANDYTVIAQREKLTELQIRVRQLIDKSEQIKREQDFQRVYTAIVKSQASESIITITD